MEITTKELRMQPGRIIDQAANGQEIIVTFRGKPLVRIVPFKKKSNTIGKDGASIFGLWKNHDEVTNVEEHIRKLRKGRQV